jgi:hypothetical protein
MIRDVAGLGIVLILCGVLAAAMAGFLLLLEVVGDHNLRTQGWVTLAICGGLALVSLAAGARLLRSQRYRSR